MKINENLLNDIKEYCILNNIEDVDAQIEQFIQIGFTVSKYGTSPFKKMEQQKNKTCNTTNNLEQNKKNIRIIQSK